MGLMNIYKRRARNSPSFVKYTQLTQVPTRSASKIDGGGKAWFALYRNIQRTIPQKQLLAGVLNMWRRHYGEVLFVSVVEHIVKLYNDFGNDA